MPEEDEADLEFDLADTDLGADFEVDFAVHFEVDFGTTLGGDLGSVIFTSTQPAARSATLESQQRKHREMER